MVVRPGTISPLVSVSWLLREMAKRGGEGKKGNLICVDSTWFHPNTPFDAAHWGHGCESAVDAWKTRRIPRSRWFDIDACSDKSTTLPHMLPETKQFEEYMTSLKIGNQDTIVCYDKIGVFSAPRVWFTLRYFGHPKEQTFVLDGGFAAWEFAGEPIVSVAPTADQLEEEIQPPHYKVPAGYPLTQMLVDCDAVAANAQKDEGRILHIDTRPAARFSGALPEPREGLRQGHTPHSVNLPFDAVVDLETGTLRSLTELERVFAEKKLDVGNPFLVSCGSGMTACQLILASEMLGADITKNLKFYDGSWTEYGATDKPLEKGE